VRDRESVRGGSSKRRQSFPLDGGKNTENTMNLGKVNTTARGGEKLARIFCIGQSRGRRKGERCLGKLGKFG